MVQMLLNLQDGGLVHSKQLCTAQDTDVGNVANQNDADIVHHEKVCLLVKIHDSAR